MIIMKKAIPRRTVLRGVGATLALPLLDSMVPAMSALSKTPAKPTIRLGTVYVPNGIRMQQFTPATDGAAFEITPILEPLASFRDRILVLTGLANKEADGLAGEGGGDHARAAGAYLTGVHPKKTEGSDLRAGISIDQIAAGVLGKETQLGSLELSLESKAPVGACDPGYSCTYGNTLCWRTPTNPLSMEDDPRAVFERLFGGGDSTDPAARLARTQEDRSILDAMTKKVARLQQGLGARDRTKVDEYLEAIRDAERRIRKAEEQRATELPVATMERPVGIPASFEEHAKLMFDLQVLAYQTDLTRVITFMMARETSNRAYPEIGVPDAHHPVSHHGGDAEKIAKVIKVNLFHAKTFAYYLEKLAATPDGDGSLLDHVMIIYGSGMSEGNVHDHYNLPTLLIGGGAGRLKSGRHLRYSRDTPVTNLFLTLLDKVGVPVETVGDSTGRVEHLSGV